MKKTYSIYFTGALFNLKDLTGNALLAEAINKLSNRKYQCVIPQDLEQTTDRAQAIRDQDLTTIMRSDLGIFSFDGTDLDSGTVIEFLFAKFLDIPSVILRTDFRLGGDDNKGGDPWNLMCSFYPRTEVVNIHSMAWYHEARAESNDVAATLQKLNHRVAAAIISALDRVNAQPSLIMDSNIDVVQLYQWALQFAGINENVMSIDEMLKIINEKKLKNNDIALCDTAVSGL